MNRKKPEPKKEASSTLSQTEYWADEKDYYLGFDHSHRQLILDALENLEFKNVLEVGCNIGQNLYRIGLDYPGTQLIGVDVNKRVLKEAKTVLPFATFKVGSATKLPFRKKFDIYLADAVWMYVDDIDKAIDEAIRVTKKALIILDFEARRPRKIGHTQVRDYGKLLTLKGLKVKSIKITKKIWNNPKWNKYGQLYVAALP